MVWSLWASPDLCYFTVIVKRLNLNELFHLLLLVVTMAAECRSYFLYLVQTSWLVLISQIRRAAFCCVERQREIWSECGSSRSVWVLSLLVVLLTDVQLRPLQRFSCWKHLWLYNSCCLSHVQEGLTCYWLLEEWGCQIHHVAAGWSVLSLSRRIRLYKHVPELSASSWWASLLSCPSVS